MLAHRASIREIAFGKILIDDKDRAALFRVGFVEPSSLPQSYVQRLEILRRRAQMKSARLRCTRWKSVVPQGESIDRHAALKWRRGCKAHGLEAGDLLERRTQLSYKRESAVCIPVFHRQCDSRGDHLVRIESRPYTNHIGEASDQQSGTNQQHQSHCDLHYNECAAHRAHSAASGHAAALAVQHRKQVLAKNRYKRKQSNE